MTAPPDNNVNPKEMALFSRLADEWWNENGQFATLHKMNPVRLSYIRERACSHFAKDPHSMTPFAGLTVLDIGCGGGILSEPMARMGAKVTSIDPNRDAIDIATAHAKQSGLAIDYQCTNSGELAQSGFQADIVQAIEILEHIDDKQRFINEAASLVKPGGMLVVSTLNRNAKSWALGIFVSEYILRWVPPGTHKWQDFTRPSELRQYITQAGLSFEDVKGMVFNPLKNDFTLSKTDFSINYITTSVKSA